MGVSSVLREMSVWSILMRQTYNPSLLVEFDGVFFLNGVAISIFVFGVIRAGFVDVTLDV